MPIPIKAATSLEKLDLYLKVGTLHLNFPSPYKEDYLPHLQILVMPP